MSDSKQFQEQDGRVQNRVQAEQYMEGVTGSKDTSAAFETFPEGGPSPIPPRILHGPLDQHFDELVMLNNQGHGIFVMVNDGKGRRVENVVGLRALFTEDDGEARSPRPPPRRRLRRWWARARTGAGL